MSYYDKIRDDIKNLESTNFPAGISVTVPHQAVTPREILEQYVINDLTAQAHPSDDNIHVEVEGMDTEDISNVQSRVLQFEDKFDAMEATRANLAYKRSRKRKKDDPIKGGNEPPAQTPSPEE